MEWLLNALIIFSWNVCVCTKSEANPKLPLSSMVGVDSNINHFQWSLVLRENIKICRNFFSMVHHFEGKIFLIF